MPGQTLHVVPGPRDVGGEPLRDGPVVQIVHTLADDALHAQGLFRRIRSQQFDNQPLENAHVLADMHLDQPVQNRGCGVERPGQQLALFLQIRTAIPEQDASQKGKDKPAQPRLRRRIRRNSAIRGVAFLHPLEQPADHGQIQPPLVLKMIMHGRHIDTGQAANLAHGGTLVPALQKGAQCGLEDFFPRTRPGAIPGRIHPVHF